MVLQLTEKIQKEMPKFIQAMKEKREQDRLRKKEEKQRERRELIRDIFGDPEFDERIRKFVESQRETERKKQEEENSRFWRSM
jgi:hypothetical protein